MMCSIEELGSSRDMYPEAPENGIYIFSDDVEVGSDAIDALGLRDTVFEYEITNNRIDCFSILGIAREAAVTFHKPFVPPVVEVHENGENVNDYIKVEVKGSRSVPPLLCKGMYQYKNRPFAQVDAKKAGCQRYPSHQQPG